MASLATNVRLYQLIVQFVHRGHITWVIGRAHELHRQLLYDGFTALASDVSVAALGQTAQVQPSPMLLNIVSAAQQLTTQDAGQ